MNEKKLILTKGEQPVAKISEEDLTFLIHREFPAEAELVRTKLNLIKSNTEKGKNRIAASVLKLAGGSLDKIDKLVRKANEDFRDIVAAAEYPRTFSYSFGERGDEERKKDYLEDWEEFSAWKERKTQNQSENE